jgi:hypothetical protein
MQTPTQEPKTYLSNTDGQWRVIWKGIPLNADTTDRARAEAIAIKYKIKLPSVIWNGEGWIQDNP